jgi:hypothetical protein
MKAIFTDGFFYCRLKQRAQHENVVPVIYFTENLN